MKGSARMFFARLPTREQGIAAAAMGTVARAREKKRLEPYFFVFLSRSPCRPHRVRSTVFVPTRQSRPCG